MTSPLFTKEQVKADGQNAVLRTAGQGLSGLAVVEVGEWIARLAGWHGTVPKSIALDLAGMFTVAAAWLSNRGKLRGEGGQSLIQVLVVIALVLIVLWLVGVRLHT